MNCLPYPGRSHWMPYFPALLLVYHSLVYPAVFPFLNLPVSDDANYFGYAKLFALHGRPLYADWTPVLTYWGAFLYRLTPLPGTGCFLCIHSPANWYCFGESMLSWPSVPGTGPGHSWGQFWPALASLIGR